MSSPNYGKLSRAAGAGVLHSVLFIIYQRLQRERESRGAREYRHEFIYVFFASVIVIDNYVSFIFILFVVIVNGAFS